VPHLNPQPGDDDFLLLESPDHPLRVECARRTLEEIHAAVLDGFRRLSRGGIEVGGVLFGQHQESLVRILAWRPILCEYAKGPVFELSEPDRMRLNQQLLLAGQDPQLEPFEPVGWFVSHTRRGLELTEADRELYGHYFPAAWQVALVLRPEKGGATQAAFFGRLADGGEPPVETPFVVALEQGGAAAGPDLAARIPPRPAPPPEEPAPAGAPEPPPPHPLAWWKIALISIGLVCAGAFLLALPNLGYVPPRPHEPLTLRLEDFRGQLRVVWARNAKAVSEADSATLEIDDGGPVPPVAIGGEALRTGSLTYARRSEDVTVRLILKRQGRVTAEERARFLGPPVPKEPPPGLREAEEERDRLRQQNERLLERLKQESVRARRLEREVRRLEEQATKK
jgi:proteasome lid subunit RPN8/RPN11